MNKPLWDELLQLTPAERFELIHDLWDSIPPEQIPPLTEAQREELRRRWEEHRRDPSTAIPWAEARERIWSRLK